MKKFSFTTTPGYNTINNINILNTSIASNISSPLSNTNPYSDAIEVNFTNPISNADAITLNNLVATWDNNVISKYDKIVGIPLSANAGINNTTYQRYGIYGYDGSTTIGKIQKITIIGYKDTNVTNYSVKIFDLTNSLTIAEVTFTNTSENIVNMGTLSNIPDNPAIIEIQVKKTGGTTLQKAYVSSVTFLS